MRVRVKRWGLIAAILGLLFLFSGCAGNKIPGEAPPPDAVTGGFSCDADIRYGDMDFSVTLTRPSIEECEIEVTDPSPLKGLKFHWQGQDLKMTYMGLNLDLVHDLFPDTSFATALNNVFNTISASQSMKVAEQDGRMIFSGASDSGDFSVTMNMQTGQLEMLCVPSLNLDVAFSSFSPYQ